MSIFSKIKRFLNNITGISTPIFGLAWARDNKFSKQKIETVANSYLDIIDGRRRGHSGLLGLIEAGSATLENSNQLIKVREIIRLHGKPDPIQSVVYRYLKNDEDILKFLRFEANKAPQRNVYQNEHSLEILINQFYSNESSD